MINKHLKPLSAHNNNNSPHKFGFKFYMWAGDQKLKYNLEWPYTVFYVQENYALQVRGVPTIQGFLMYTSNGSLIGT